MPELIWDGKYDAAGRQIAPLRIALPFQTVETVNESAQDRQRSIDFFAHDRPSEWRNRLIWGDRKYVLPALLTDFSGQVDLIYIDPPFMTGDDFSFTARLPKAAGSEQTKASEGFTKKPSLIETKAYRDTWGVSPEARARGATYLDTYLRWFYDTAAVLRELLSPTGSIYVHLDWHVGPYAKVLLDEVFGRASFQNEIIWQRTSAHSDTHRYGLNYDVIFFYSKSEKFTWNGGYHQYSAKQLARYRTSDEDRPFADFDLTQAGLRKGSSGKPWRGYDPAEKGNHWKFDIPTLERMDAEGRIYWPKTGGFPRMKRYLDEAKGVSLQSVWTDIFPVNSQAKERLGYETQKPEALLQRIIEASSNPNDLVLDCFCGSGTTAAVAERLNRRWIAGDLGRFAIHTTRKRLLDLPDVRPFTVQNLGKYERQLWQKAEFGETAIARTAAYRSFILKLYHATPVSGHAWLHGLRSGRMVHVGTVDAPITVGDIRQIVAEFRKVVGTGENAPRQQSIDILGWDFAFELNEVARQDAERAGIDLRLIHIPREVLDKQAVEQGDIRFFELAALSVSAKQSGRKITLAIDDFVIPVDDVPADVQKAITHWSQWIDYWAIDWDNHDDTFHNEWQSYRTRESAKLDLLATHEYLSPGEYTVVIKVIDILGNDTTKTMRVKVVGGGR